MLELYKPNLEDLWFKEKMLNDDLTMSYNRAYGGTITFPREKWAGWYDRWIINHENRRLYRYIKKEDTFLGEIAYHYDEVKKMYLADVIIYAPFRRQGYGKIALALLCEEAKKNGVRELYDQLADDNPAIDMFLKYGFEEVERIDKSSILIRKML